jgi:hypothetical protein
MKLYKIEWHDRDNGECIAWAGTIEDAKLKVKELKEDYGVDWPSADPSWKLHDVPTDKPGLLAWLSLYVTSDNG